MSELSANGSDERTVVSFDEWVSVNASQLQAAAVPPHLYNALYDKLSTQTFDAGDYFCLAESESAGGLVAYCVKDVTVAQPDAVFLIDHAWTFRWSDARAHLTAIPGLLERMAKLVGVEDADVTDAKDALCDHVLQRLPLFAQTYSVNNRELSDEQRQPVWYVMDEFGSHVGHSGTDDDDGANVSVMPFVDLAMTGQAYSIMFPVRDIPADNVRSTSAIVTRDFVAGRGALAPYFLLPWDEQDYSDLSEIPPAPDVAYFSTMRTPDKPYTAPEKEESSESKKVLKVYADDDRFVSHLSHKRFTLTNNKDEADVWWLRQHLHDYSKLRPLVNQFPGECVLTVKDLLAACIRRYHAQTQDVDIQTADHLCPSWLPTTYNLITELPHFISCFQRRQKKGRNNAWIVKPWNLARGLDMHVTDDLAFIIRLVDSGPKIVSKYIEKPVLFHREDINCEVKFDMRFIVIIRSLDPLDIRVYNKFWLRFANKSFSLDHFDDYEKHFTVHNYSNPDQLLQMRCEDFIVAFEKQQSAHEWKAVEQAIHSVIGQSITMATMVPAPNGLMACPKSRSMLGVDVMLRHDDNGNVCPVLLEYNYNPDCTRACEYYADFADAVFDCMFLPECEWTHAKTQFVRL